MPTRKQIINSALRKVGAMPSDGNPPINKLRDAVTALNNIIYVEEGKGHSGMPRLHARSTYAIILEADKQIYPLDGVSVRDLQVVMFRGTNADDSEIAIIDLPAWSRLTSKYDSGDPDRVYLEKNATLLSQKLYVYPIPSSIGTTSTVRVSNVQYQCIREHTSSTDNQPTTGDDYQLYWQSNGEDVGSDTWATDTEYTNGKSLILTFERPLTDFTDPFDTPDIPRAWTNYLIYKLAVDLAPEYNVSSDKYAVLKKELKDIYDDIFPGSRAVKSEIHNKATYF